MLRYHYFVVIFILLSQLGLNGQDIHYSQFFNSPLNLSPGLTGVFNGNTRLHANYKQQWASVPVDYVSADIGADYKFGSLDSGSYFSLGGLINYDTAGDLNLGWTGVNLFLSYSLKLGDNLLLTPGVKGGYLQRSYDPENAITGNQWNGKVIDPSLSTEFLQLDQNNFIDIGGGLNLRWQKHYRKHIDVGVALAHFNEPNDIFQDSVSYVSERPRKLSVYLLANLPLSDDLDLIVNGLYAKQNAYQEIVVNAQGKIYLNKNNNAALYLGAGYRFDDAWYPMIALEYGQLYGAFSYDLNFSDFEIATGGKGGPELSLRYIFSKIPEGPNNPF